MHEEYCGCLIDKCISSIKERGYKKFDKKFSLLKGPKLTVEQFEKLVTQGELLDKFFDSFDKYSKLSKDKKDPNKQLFSVWTLGLDKCFTTSSKQKREDRIGELQGLHDTIDKLGEPEIFNALKATLNFTLAMAILAKEMKRASPNKNEMNRSRAILKESAKFLEPAKIALKYDFINYKNFSLRPIR